MARSKGLGRGLSSLIGENGVDGVMDNFGKAGDRVVAPMEIELERVEPNPFQPRREFSGQELEELAQSIREHGVLQPVVVRPAGTGYELIAGERRLRAAKLAGKSRIPVLVREASDDQMTALALIENIQRQDLNPMEEAVAYSRLSAELNWSQEHIAEQVGKSRSHVANYFRLLQLDGRIQQWVRDGGLTMAHAKLLLGIEDLDRRGRLAEACVIQGWTVRELERRSAMAVSAEAGKGRRPTDVHMLAVEEGLRRALGTGVRVRGDGRRGRIEIKYQSLEELERLIELLATSEAATEKFPV
jgi:ParB family chromosome partitioning protein